MLGTLRGAAILTVLVLLGSAGCRSGGTSSGETIAGTISVTLSGSARADYVQTVAGTVNADEGENGFRQLLAKTDSDGPYFPCPPLPAGYSDVQEGTTVKVADGSGETLGIGDLDAGKVTFPDVGCIFEFTITDVPGDEDFYEITAGSRGGETYSQSDMVASNWRVELSLG